MAFRRFRQNERSPTDKVNLPFFLIDTPDFYQQEKGSEAESQKMIFFCIRNKAYMHFIAPF